MTYDDVNGGQSPVYPGGVSSERAMDSPEALLFPISRAGYPTPAQGRLSTGNPVLLPGNYAPTGARTTEPEWICTGEDREETNAPQGNVPQNGLQDSPRTATLRILEAHRITHRGNPNQQAFRRLCSWKTGQLREHRGRLSRGDGFTQVTETAGQRHFPFVA